MGSTSELTFPELLAKYEQEQQKRPHPSTHAESFVDIGKADQFKHFGKDPRKTAKNPYLSAPSPVKNGDHTKILVIGTGFAALLFVVHFIETGYAAVSNLSTQGDSDDHASTTNTSTHSTCQTSALPIPTAPASMASQNMAGSPAFRAGITITGRNGLSMDEKWNQRQGPETLHGIITRGFPNLFFPGVVQAAATVNILYGEDLLATHTARILRAARERAAGDGGKIVIEPTTEAEEEWAMRVVAGGYGFAAAAQSAGLTGTPNSQETGDYKSLRMKMPAVDKTKDVLKMARRLPWLRGILDFTEVLEEWENRRDLNGLDICVL
ncbi:hypothetical protein FQN50_001647 [Emmonsiellopsis sp. PD_5]|nr:hypothetical protein FQN50_001647 [Emmonsiellopsis sp. PD_5]